jgi:hypothetical protein
MSENDIVITKESAIEALKAAVDEKGEDYVYVNAEGQSPTSLEDSVQCSYVHWNFAGGYTTGCIVGNALHRHGVLLRDFLKAEYRSADELEDYVPNLVFEEGVGRILQAAQAKQDAGKTWGTALSAAVAHATVHADYPHNPGTLHDCVACEDNCYCSGVKGDPKCLHCSLGDGDFEEAMACGE